MNYYNIFKRGTVVDIHADDDTFIARGTIITAGTAHASIITQEGESADVPYANLRQAGLTKQATIEHVKEEEKDGHTFVLAKEETNKDGVLSVIYRVLVDDKPISESEEIIMNVYDTETGWSAPDDFDENKVELLRSTYESGFDLLVESYSNIAENLQQPVTPDLPKEPEEPEGKPAFAPGVSPAGPVDETGGATDQAAPGMDGIEGMADEVPEDAGAPEDTGSAAAEPAGEVVSSSRSFARSVLGSKGDNRLHNNPQHRLNPFLRAEMDRRGIDSGNTNDIELAEKLKSFDYSGAAPKKRATEALIDKIRNSKNEG